MKKKQIISTLLCLLLVFSSLTAAFAEPAESVNAVQSFSMNLMTDAATVDVMQKSGLEKFGVEKVAVTSDMEGTADMTASGTITTETFDLDNETQTFTFANDYLEEYVLDDGDTLYVGCLDGSIEMNGERLPVLADFACSTDFIDYRASVSIGTIENNAGLLFFGELFPEYSRYVEELQTVARAVEIEEASQQTSRYVEVDDEFEHEGTAVNWKMGSTSGSNETVVVTAASRDFANMGENAVGFEVIRIFGRSANAAALVDGATSALPSAATATFKCTTTGFLSITDTYPKENVIELPELFNVFGSLDDKTGTFLAFVNLLAEIISPVDVTTSTGNAGEVNQATVEMVMDSDTASSANLPSSVGYSNAKSNQQNGVSCKFTYRPDSGSATQGYVQAKGRMTYIAFIGGQTSSISTGEATVAHYSHKA